MSLSRIANVVDLEIDGNVLLEIGITEVDLISKSIIKTYSYPVQPGDSGYEVSDEVCKLTGWTAAKLRKQGFHIMKIQELLHKRGFSARLLITDKGDEIPTLDRLFHKHKNDYLDHSTKNWTRFPFSPARLDISILFKLKTSNLNNLGLSDMLNKFGMRFEGTKHRAGDDSYNIARLFLKLLEG